uniref:Uncharacterized protein n=1 Tax=Opuntia streptacantha TaxID=393608 RepID=A0A7C9A9E5_OPUST
MFSIFQYTSSSGLPGASVLHPPGSALQTSVGGDEAFSTPTSSAIVVDGGTTLSPPSGAAVQTSSSPAAGSASVVHGRGHSKCVTVSTPTASGGVRARSSGCAPPCSPSTGGVRRPSSSPSRLAHVRRFLGLYTCRTGFTYGEVCNIDGWRVRG